MRLAPFSVAMLALLLLPCMEARAQSEKIIGYYTSWSIYGRNFHVPDIQADKITHINYAFANISGGKIILGDHYADVDKFYPGDCWSTGCLRGCFNRLIQLKKNHTHVKTLISVGGWTWSGGFSDAVLTASSRRIFATSCVDFMIKYSFDGVDIDWEYPVSGGLPTNKTRPQDKQNFTLFLNELRSQLDAKGKQNNRHYLLTIAAPANPAIIQNIEVNRIVPYLDWINIMTYDFHGPWKGTLDPVTNFNSPLYAVKSDPTPEPFRSTFNLSAAVKAYLALGVPRQKLNPGMAFYGRGFGGVTGTANGLHAKYTGPAPVGTWEKGVFDYLDLKLNYINKGGYKAYRHPEARVPWIYNAAKGIMIGYDDVRSIQEKAWFVKAAGLGGAMFWEFSCDRNADLLGTVYEEIRTRPALRAPNREISIKTPILADLFLEGGKSRAGRLYLVLGSLTGTYPGLSIPGDVFPLNYDWFTALSLKSNNTSLFPNTVGYLDAGGSSRAGVDFRILAPLSPHLVGLRVSFSGWVVRSSSSVAGEAANAVDIFLVP